MFRKLAHNDNKADSGPESGHHGCQEENTPKIPCCRDPPFSSTNALGLPEINSRVPWVKWVGIPENMLAGHMWAWWVACHSQAPRSPRPLQIEYLSCGDYSSPISKRASKKKMCLGMISMLRSTVQAYRVKNDERLLEAWKLRTPSVSYTHLTLPTN